MTFIRKSGTVAVPGAKPVMVFIVLKTDSQKFAGNKKNSFIIR